MATSHPRIYDPFITLLREIRAADAIAIDPAGQDGTSATSKGSSLQTNRITAKVTSRLVRSNQAPKAWDRQDGTDARQHVDQHNALVFFDTTSIYFEGEGGETLGELGHTKDHRPDLNQMIVGTVLDGQGRPICCELWPGNTTDVKTLIPVVDRLRSRFGIKRVCIVADRGMISKETIEDLENDKRDWLYILGARMRAQSEVRDEVISRGGRYRVVHPEREFSDDLAPRSSGKENHLKM